jgi:putative DNA primase/helicase
MSTARERIETAMVEISLDDRRQRRQRKKINSDAAIESDGFADTDIANARRLARLHGEVIRYTAAADWIVWDGRRWRIDEKGIAIQAHAKDTALSIFDEIKRARDRDTIIRHAKYSQSRRAIESMIALARSEPGIPNVLTDFDADPLLLNVSNGTLDLRTGALRQHSLDDRITKIANVSYDQHAPYQLWDAFLRRVLDGNDDLYTYIRRLVGYMLTGLTTEQVLHFLYGLGANGKSVFCEIISEMLGEYVIICSPELIMLRRNSTIPNDIARLRGARVALMNETTQGSRFDEAKLKDLTGSDSLTGRFLHREFFDFKPTHKLVIRGNHKPAINGTDEGIWRRLRLVPFTVQIPPAEQDRTLLDKLRGELPGILRWAVEGCLEWQRDGLNPPAIIAEAVQQYRQDSDTLGQCIAEHCEVKKLAQVKSGSFFQRYQQFADQSGERWIAHKDLPHEMARRGFEWKRTNSGGMYFGVELRASMNVPNWGDE